MDDTDITVSRRTFVILFLLLNLYPVSLSLQALQWVPQQKRMLVEMDMPITAVTSVLFTTYRFLWLLPLLSIALTVGVMVRWNNVRALAAAAVVATFGVTFLLLALLNEGTMRPLRLLLMLG